MRPLLILAAALVLAGCSSMKLGGFAYCPYGQNCSFQQLAPTKAEPAAPAASGVSA
jgi:hypothetical protein